MTACHWLHQTERRCQARSMSPPSLRAKEKGYGKLPLLDESVAAHLCPPTAIGSMAKAIQAQQDDFNTRWTRLHIGWTSGLCTSLHGGPPCLPGQTPPVHGRGCPRPHSCAARLTWLYAPSRPWPGRSAGMANLVLLDHHLWLTLMEIKSADKAPLLDSAVYPTGLFGPTP